MDFTVVSNIAKDAIMMIISLSLPILLIGMLVGLLVNVVQTLTSVQEQSVSYVVKFVAIAVSVLLLSNWLMKTLTSYTTSLFEKIPYFIK
jgi:flagellar biosynthetic protein FliQ